MEAAIGVEPMMEVLQSCHTRRSAPWAATLSALPPDRPQPNGSGMSSRIS